MPIFEYHCMECDHDFEVLVVGDQDVSCPTCQGNNIKKLLSACSHKSGGEFTSSPGSSCGTCSSTNCGTCGMS